MKMECYGHTVIGTPEEIYELASKCYNKTRLVNEQIFTNVYYGHVREGLKVRVISSNEGFFTNGILYNVYEHDGSTLFPGKGLYLVDDYGSQVYFRSNKVRIKFNIIEY